MFSFAETPAPTAVDFWSASAADWFSAVGTVGATVVALIFGVSAYKTKQREQRERQIQARLDKARVYCWADAYVPSYEKGGVVWVKNDTDLPINHVAVNILTGPAPDKEPLSMATGLRLAPRETKTIEVEGKHLSPTLAYSQINAFITFTDVDGYAWTRHPNGALTPSPCDELQMPTPLDQGRPAPM